MPHHLHNLHIELWTWLSEHPSKKMHEWPRWKAFRITRMHFACQEAAKQNDIHKLTSPFLVLCDHCPISWSKYKPSSCCSYGASYSVYTTDRVTLSLTYRSRLADLISLAPWKQSEKEEVVGSI